MWDYYGVDIMMSRKVIVYDGDEIVSETIVDRSWDYVRHHRDKWLKSTDNFVMVKDRFSDDDYDAILEYRQKLRDLPQDFDEANDACDNWPSRPRCIKKHD